MIGIIYKHTNLINNKAYIGQTIQPLAARMRQGYYGTKFAKAVEKYGWESFSTVILYRIERQTKEELVSELNQIEEALIKKYKLQNDKYGYNVKAGGSNGTFTHRPESIEKIRIAAKRPNSGQFKKGQASVNKGKTWSNSDEYKERHSKIMKDSYAISGRKSPMFGRKHSNESRLKISIANKNRVVGQYPTHSRWHIARGLKSDDCGFCNE